MKPIDVVERYFAAMQAGQTEAEALFSLFSEDAIYVEPFTAAAAGHTSEHVGLPAIKQCIRASWEHAPPELELKVNRVDVDGEVVVSEWTCSSPAFDNPIKGRDVCTVKGGRIQRLEVSFA